MERQMIEGTEIELGGQKWIVPALNFKRIKQLKPIMEKLTASAAGPSDISDEAIDAAAQLVHLALSRNYPEVKIDDIEEWLDLRNFRDIVMAIVGQSGLVLKGAAGEA